MILNTPYPIKIGTMLVFSLNDLTFATAHDDVRWAVKDKAMKIILGKTNPDVWHNLDVFLDGKLLDREHYGVIEADDVTGCVRYVMFNRSNDGLHAIVLDDADLSQEKIFKVYGKVELRDRAFVYCGR